MKTFFTPLMIFIVLLCSFNAYSIPKLSSLPSAPSTIFLDFDGHYVVSSVWNGGNPINCAPSGMTDLQITEVFNRVAEDFRPFDVNITTDSAKFLAAPITQRIRVIITPSSAWYPGAGGVSYIGSFTWGDDTPAFVFSDKLPVGGPVYPKMVAECCSHESGHTLGLNHQSKYDNSCNLLETYSSGAGSGETAWSPVMGNSYYKNMTGWNDGPTPYDCVNTQDNLTTISTQNGFGYRADDYTETLNAGTFGLSATNFNVSGIITTSTDKDAFRFSLSLNSNFQLNAVPFNVGPFDEGANLDIKLSLYNTAGSLIRTYNPLAIMNVNVDTVLNAGTYYLRIEGTGNSNVSAYSSIGSYTITGNSTPLPIRDITLSGTVDKNKHNLNWNIIADEPMKNITVEVSSDGSSFQTLTTVAAYAKNFSYLPYNSNTLYYRLKAVSVINQTAYSNTIVLRGSGKTEKLFSVSTLVQSDVSVNAAEIFQYRISDANGRPVSSGKGTKGINKININNQPGGLYIISIFSNNQIQSELIIKQ